MKKSLSTKILAVLLSILLIVTVAPLTVLAADSDLQSDGNGGYFVNMPATGTLDLDLQGRPNGFSFKAYDDGGSNGAYSENCAGTLIITAIEGTVLKISGSGNVEGFDFLQVFDGDTDTQIGNPSYTDNFEMAEMSTTANVLKLYFESDDEESYDGFELTVTLASSSVQEEDYDAELSDDGNGGYFVNMPKSVTATLDLTDKEDGFSFKIYDDGGQNGNYSNNCDGYMIVNAPAGFIMSIDGGGQTESGVDQLQLFDDDTMIDNPKAGTFTLSGMATTGNVLKVYFHSDEGTTLSGFEIEVTLTQLGAKLISGEDGYYINMPANETQTLTLHDVYDGFSFQLYDDGGAENNYSNNCNGSLLISVPGDYVIRISGPCETENNYDWLTVYDGDTNNYLGSRTSGTFDFNPVTTSGNVMKVSFTSDGSTTRSGLNLTVTVLALSGFATVNYKYNDDVKMVRYDPGELTLPTFISMFDLPNGYRFVGWELSESVYAEDSTYVVYSSTTYNFNAVLEEIPVIQQDDEYGYYTLLPKSGNLLADLTGREDGFTLWVFDNGGSKNNYTDNCDGSVTITAKDGKLLRVSADVDTETNYDFFYVYDGSEVDPSNAFIQYSGTNTAPNVYSAGNSITVRLKTDGSQTRSGIKVQVTVVDPDDFVHASFDPGAGGGQLDDFVGMPGDVITLPECLFDVPEGYLFDGYTDGENRYEEGARYTLTQNVQFTALYVQKITFTFENGLGETEEYVLKKGSKFSFPNYTIFSELPYRKSFSHWYCAAKDRSIAESFQMTVEENMVFTAIYEELPILIEDIPDYGPIAMLPRIGEATLDLTGRPNGFTFTVLDNKGYNYYSNNCDGTLNIVAPEGYVFIVKGTADLSNDANDYFNIYDNYAGAYLGESQYKGYGITVPEYTSSGNSISIYMYSDEEYTSNGIVLTVMMVDPDTVVNLMFNPGQGTGTMDNIKTVAGAEVVLPENEFEAPEGKIFAGYIDGNNVYQPGDVYIPESNVRFMALFADQILLTFKYDEYSTFYYAAAGYAYTMPYFDSIFGLPQGMIFGCWQAGDGNQYDEGTPYVFTEDTVFTAVLENEPLLTEDGEGGWYVNMPSDHQATLDLTDKQEGFSFKLYDNGGKDDVYSSGSDGYLLIKAPQGLSIKVSGGGTTESSQYDYLYFYDGEDNSYPLLGTGGKYGGTFEIKSIVSSGNMMEIFFHSDSSVVADGFEFTVSLVEPVTVTYTYDEESVTVAYEKNSDALLINFEDYFELPYGLAFDFWVSSEYGDYAEGSTINLTDKDVYFSAVLYTMPTLSFDGNGAEVIGGKGETVTEPFPVRRGEPVFLPEYDVYFNCPDGKVFGGWELDGEIYDIGAEYSLYEDTVYTAVWNDPSPWDIMAQNLAAEPGTDLGTIVLTEDLIAGTGSDVLVVPDDVTVNIDLNGHVIDGNKVATRYGYMMFVRGNLTITDSKNTGGILGGGVQVLSGEQRFVAPNRILQSFKAELSLRYTFYQPDEESEEYTWAGYSYATVYFPTLLDALNAATNYYFSYGFMEDVEIPEGIDDYRADIPQVTMLADATISEGEVWRVDAEESITLDLNGYTFENKGTFTGGVTHGEGEEEWSRPTFIMIDSTTPGLFRSSGNIGVALQPWTADTYYITGGEITGFFGADGGNINISGGVFTGEVFFNNGSENDLTVNLSGDAEFARAEIYVYSKEEAADMCVTISDNVKIKSTDIGIFGNNGVYSGSKPNIIVNGGYFVVDPHSWWVSYDEYTYEQLDLDNLEQYYIFRNGEYVCVTDLEDGEIEEYSNFYIPNETKFQEFIEINGDVERYSGQPDWDADPEEFEWRVSGGGQPQPLVYGDVDGVSGVTAADSLIVLQASIGMRTLNARQTQLADVDGAVGITAIDSLYILQYSVGLRSSLG